MDDAAVGSAKTNSRFFFCASFSSTPIELDVTLTALLLWCACCVLRVHAAEPKQQYSSKARSTGEGIYLVNRMGSHRRVAKDKAIKSKL